MTDELIEAIAREISYFPAEQYSAEEIAQAALDALKAEGVMLCRWEKQAMHDEFERAFSRHITISVNDQPYKLIGLEPPAAALAGRKDEAV